MPTAKQLQAALAEQRTITLRTMFERDNLAAEVERLRGALRKARDFAQDGCDCGECADFRAEIDAALSSGDRSTGRGPASIGTNYAPAHEDFLAFAKSLPDPGTTALATAEHPTPVPPEVAEALEAAVENMRASCVCTSSWTGCLPCQAVDQVRAALALLKKEGT
jgi:hypothetical protein